MAASRKVLLIDDDVDFRASARALLESYGCQVFEAESGHEGLQKVIEYKPDLIFLDIMMETTDEGYGVAHSLRYLDEYAAYRNIPIVMVSSIEESPDERFAMCPEVEMIRPDKYLTKPLEIPRLLDVLQATA